MRQPVPFGKYVLLERISVGGMAEVFKSKSFGVEGFEKILAIKRILPSLAEDSDFIEMFIDEAKICGQLNHANICQIFELGQVEDSHFIAMEFVWGKDLLQIQNRLRKMRQTMTPQMAAHIATKLCEGLDYAHKKKDPTGKPLLIIHRDISPQNILISYEGELKIIDFGIAKAASRSSKTQAGVLKGKFGYMSPEQVRGLPLDRRSDVFAIGTILYELLTSDRLFIGESDFETLEKVRNVACVPPSRANPACPPALEKIILKALTKEVEERYQWASEMMEDLQAFLMTHEPVFTAKQLSHWMREAFQPEMRREQEILDEQRKVGRQVLTVPVAAGFGVSAQPVLATPSPVNEMPAENTRVADDDDDLEELSEDDALEEPDEPDEQAGRHLHDEPEFEDRTMVSGPSFGGGSLPRSPPPPGAPLSDEKTAILADAALSPLRPGPPSSLLALDAKQSAQSSVVLADSAPIVVGARSGADPRAPTVEAPSYGRPGSNGIGQGRVAGHPRTGTGQVNAPRSRSYAPQRSTLWKDILIGVAVAAALVGGVLGVRALLGNGAARGTLVVMAQPALGAEVLVDGDSRGRLAEGHPLTLRDLAPGPHAVVVRAPDGASFEQTVQLAAGDVSVLSAVLTAPARGGSVGTGLLRLHIATEGAQVEVDGAQLADGAWRAPIPLRADVAHDIRVTKPQREEVKLSVTLRAGEELRKDIELLPGYGKIQITTQPEGAEISLNGHRAGLTPALLGNLNPGKQARVVLRHKGFAPVTKYVSFERSLVQQLDVHMVPSANDGMSGAEGEERPKGGIALADVSVPEPGSKARTHEKNNESDGKGDELKTASKEPAAPKDAPRPGAGEPGFLVANTQPWAKVLIDGKDTGKTTPIAPRAKIPLRPGKHVVTFVANGRKFNFDIVVKPAEDTRLIKQLADSP